MQIKLLKDVVENTAGKNAVGIVELLFGKKNVNEFLIAKKLKLTINQARNILYKLADKGLVSSIRKKDKRKGWYTYFWTLDNKKTLLFLDSNINKEIVQLQNQLKNRQNKRFYFCKRCSIEVNEETALFNNFACKECGEIYELNIDKKIIDSLETRIERMKKESEVIKKEVEEIDQKLQKSRAFKEKKEEKLKKREAEKKRAKRKRMKEKEMKKRIKGNKKLKQRKKPKAKKKKRKKKREIKKGKRKNKKE